MTVREGESDPNARWEQLLAEFERTDEAYGAAVVEHVLHARVERRDLPRAPRGTVDAEIIYADGHTAALEFTSVESSATWHLRGRLRELEPSAAPGRLMWIIRPESVSDLDRLLQIHERVIGICEMYGVANPESLPSQVIDTDADIRWLAWEGASGSMSGHAVPKNPRVFWEAPLRFAVFSSEAEEIAAGLAAALKQQPCVGHIAKLLHDSHPERHLFLIVGETGLSPAAAFALVGVEEVPNVDPDIPVGLDHLWLGSGWGETVTIWTRGQGWRSEQAREPRWAGGIPSHTIALRL